MAQILGMSLKEIGALSDELRDHGISDDRSIEIMSMQLRRIEERMAEMNVMAGYLRAKVSWLKSGKQGPEPELNDFGAVEFDGTCG